MLARRLLKMMPNETLTWLAAHPKLAAFLSATLAGGFFFIRQWGRLNAVQQDTQEIKARLDRNDRENRARQVEILQQVGEMRQMLISHLARSTGD